MLAPGAASAIALARSRTMEALVLNRSIYISAFGKHWYDLLGHTISGHSRLSGYTSGDQDDLGTSEGLFEARRFWGVALDIALGVDVTDVGSDTCHYLLEADQTKACLLH